MSDASGQSEVTIERPPWHLVVRLGRQIVRETPGLRRLGIWTLRQSPRLRAFVLTRVLTRSAGAYRDWIIRHDTLSGADRSAIAARIALLPPRLISVVMPVYNPREAWLSAAIESVLAQLYPHWELCIADDASTAPEVAAVLTRAARDARVTVIRRAENGHIAAATNSALAIARGEFVALMDHDDLLSEHALYMAAEELARHPDTDLVYSDEDQVDARGRRAQPHFKTDWDPDLARGQNMVSHLGVYRRSLLVELGGLRGGFEGSQDHDLVLRVASATTAQRIRHIPAVLYHWRQTGTGSFSEGAPQRCAAASRRAIAAQLAAEGDGGAAVVVHPTLPLWARVVRRLPPSPPKVSVIVHDCGRPDLLRRCADGLLDRGAYPNLELLVVTGNAPDVVATRLPANPHVRLLANLPGATVAARTNRAASLAEGDLLLLLAADVGVSGRDWLDEMVAQALRPDVGAVGAKLLRPDRRVQHGGLVLGAGADGVAASYEAGASAESPGYAGRLQLLREVSAVSGACMAMRAKVFAELGGLEADPQAAAFADVDLCLRLRALGLRVLWTPFATLLRALPHESADDAAQAHRHVAAAWMRARWGGALEDDAFYNANFAPSDGTYHLAAPRRRPPWQGAAQAAWVIPRFELSR